MKVEALRNATSGALLATWMPLSVISSIFSVLALVLPGFRHWRNSFCAVFAPHLGRLLLRRLIRLLTDSVNREIGIWSIIKGEPTVPWNRYPALQTAYHIIGNAFSSHREVQSARFWVWEVTRASHVTTRSTLCWCNYYLFEGKLLYLLLKFLFLLL